MIQKTKNYQWEIKQKEEQIIRLQEELKDLKEEFEFINKNKQENGE